ncbi:glycoside hydrolase family 3 protein [Muricauda sp. JGD-17]|uniref:beta-N-acetylhexosaminidase n=1 Tax=Flagellimonas ochracea TaxID=2696472 RepID=A0A964WWD9_9FLAO|nr:glycoside hydrolase family 3 protein [Allomuricauda ochracea]NAY90504.1 glycoside hydrolase family 3 protein [Allomuricauda ochracea]
MNEKILKYEDAKRAYSLQQKVGQLFMPAVFINDSEEEVQRMERLIQNFHIGSLCFFHSRASAATNFEGNKKIEYNAKSSERIKELIERYQKAAEIPLLIAIDAEWGLAMRIEETPQYPYAITLGALQKDNNLIYEVGRNIGMDCKEAGIHWNLAPVVDINNNPDNPVIGYRSFGDDKANVIKKGKAFIQGMKSVGILNALKHFPGHGDTAVDSHLGLPIIDKTIKTLQENELAPFQNLMDQDVDAIMIGHMLLPQLDKKNPSTTSSFIITELLRKKMGFSGAIISDALNMHAVSKRFPEKGQLEVAAFNAGMDIFCFSEHPEEALHSILQSASEKRIEESFQRLWQLKEKVFLQKSHNADTPRVGASELNKKIAERSITELYGNPKMVETIKSSDFVNLSVVNGKSNLFSSKINTVFGQQKLAIDLGHDELIAKWAEINHVVLALFPPAVKPKNQFGFNEETLGMIKRMVKEKNTLIYLFGNPYVLDILDLQADSNVVLAYQDFPEFQEAAFDHFQGAIEAKGRLPIKLKTLNS